MTIERRLSMSFQTERPKSAAEMIAELKESKLERKSNRRAILESFNAKKEADQRSSILESAQAEIEEEALANEHIESIRDRRREERAVKESSLNRLTLLESAKKITMNKVLFEMVYDAYWLDDDVKRESIQETYNEYCNVLALVESLCGDSKTKDGDKTEFIKNVESVVEEACKKAVDRIIKEQKDSGDPTKEFEFTSEEESDLDKKLNELGRDEIVDLVKKKVLTVVQDERKSGKEKAEMLKELDKTDDDDCDNNNDENEEDPIEEGAIGIAMGIGAATIVGTTVACLGLENKERSAIKKAVKIYEEKENPKIKLSSLTSEIFELDKDGEKTDAKLTGIKKFLNGNSKRAKVWTTSSGEYVCSNVHYSKIAGIKVSAGIANGGLAAIVGSPNKITYRLYDINKKYKKDEAYLCAAMCLTDGVMNEHTLTFVKAVKKKYPDEFTDTKVKFFGKSLEGTDYEEYGEEPIEEGAMGDGIAKLFNKMKKSANHIRYTHKSNSTKRMGTDSEIEAAIRVYDKYSPTKFKRKDLQFIVLTQSNPMFEEMCELVTDIDPERVFSIMNISYTPDKIIIASLVIYDLNESGAGNCTTSFCPNYGITDDDKLYLTAILLNRYHGNPKSISYTSKFIDFVKTTYSEEMTLMLKKTVTEGLECGDSEDNDDTGEESVEEGFFSKFNKKKNGPSVQEAKLKLSDSDMGKLEQMITSEVEKLVNKHKKDADVKKYKQDITCEIEESSNTPRGTEISLVVHDGSQEDRIELCFAERICRELKNVKTIKYICKDIHFGDGDEGCVYLKIDPDKAYELLHENEPVEEGFFANLKDNMRHNKELRDVSKHLNLFGKDCAGVFNEAYKLHIKGNYDEAIKKYTEYIKIINSKQKEADRYIKEKGYNSAISQATRTGLSQEINLTKSYIAQCKEKKKKAVSENYRATLESMITQKQRRSLRNSMGGTLFESFMIANSNSIRDEAIMEGMDIDTDSTMNAALIETILQYTVLETLNTTKLYKFTSSDVMKLRAHNRSTLRN